MCFFLLFGFRSFHEVQKLASLFDNEWLVIVDFIYQILQQLDLIQGTIDQAIRFKDLSQ